jgi:hypothetical protein
MAMEECFWFYVDFPPVELKKSQAGSLTVVTILLESAPNLMLYLSWTSYASSDLNQSS